MFSMLKLWNKFSEKQKPFSKNWSTVNVKVLTFKTQHFHTKLSRQKPILRQMGVQNARITKSGTLPVTIFFFLNFCVSIRTSYEELIWCINYPNIHIHNFCWHWSFISRCFFPLSILNYYSPWNYPKTISFLIISGGTKLILLGSLDIKRKKNWQQSLDFKKFGDFFAVVKSKNSLQWCILFQRNDLRFNCFIF